MKDIKLEKYYRNFSLLYEDLTGKPVSNDDQVDNDDVPSNKCGKSLEDLLKEIGAEVSRSTMRIARESRILKSPSRMKKRLIFEQAAKEAAENPSFLAKCKEAWTKIVGAAGLLGRVDNIKSFTDQICGLLGLESSGNPSVFAEFIRRYDMGNRPTFPSIFIVEGRALQRYFEETYLKKAKTDFEKIMAYVQCSRDIKAFKDFYLPYVSMTPRQIARAEYANPTDPTLFDKTYDANWKNDQRERGEQGNVPPMTSTEKYELYMTQLKKIVALKEGNPDTDFSINKFAQFVGLGRKYIQLTGDKLNPKNPIHDYPIAFVAYDSKLDDSLDTVFTIMPKDVSNPDDTSAVADKIGTIVASIIDPKAIKNS